jgi:hypothetical protein
VKEELESEECRRPMGLVNFVSESLKAKAVIPVQDFLQVRDSIYRGDWSELPWRFVVWGLEKLMADMWCWRMSRHVHL